MKAAKTFTHYLKEGSPFDCFKEFKGLNKVINPEGEMVRQ